jgi:hypothetical protein
MLRLVPRHPAHSRAPVQGFNARHLSGKSLAKGLPHPARRRHSLVIRHSPFVIHSSFVIRVALRLFKVEG